MFFLFLRYRIEKTTNPHSNYMFGSGGNNRRYSHFCNDAAGYFGHGALAYPYRSDPHCSACAYPYAHPYAHTGSDANANCRIDSRAYSNAYPRTYSGAHAGTYSHALH